MYATDFSVSLKLLDFSFVSVSKLLSSSSLLNFASAEPEIASFSTPPQIAEDFILRSSKTSLLYVSLAGSENRTDLLVFGAYTLSFCDIFHME